MCAFLRALQLQHGFADTPFDRRPPEGSNLEVIPLITLNMSLSRTKSPKKPVRQPKPQVAASTITADLYRLKMAVRSPSPPPLHTGASRQKQSQYAGTFASPKPPKSPPQSSYKSRVAVSDAVVKALRAPHISTPPTELPKPSTPESPSQPSTTMSRSLFRARTEEELLSGATSSARQALADASHRIEPYKLDGSLLKQGAVGELQWIPGDGDAQETTSKQNIHDVTEALVWVSGLVSLKHGMHAPLMQWLERWWGMEALRKSRLIVSPSSPMRVATEHGSGVFKTPTISSPPTTANTAVSSDAGSEEVSSPTMWDRAAQRVQERRTAQKLRLAASPKHSPRSRPCQPRRQTGLATVLTVWIDN